MRQLLPADQQDPVLVERIDQQLGRRMIESGRDVDVVDEDAERAGHRRDGDHHSSSVGVAESRPARRSVPERSPV